MRPAHSGLDASERRVLNPRPWRVFRKSWSVDETKAGAIVVALLALVAGWVAWRGAHPDPALLADPATAAGGRGGLPAALAAPGWREGAPELFGAEDLYVKIDGRAEFFLSRGFRSLAFVTLAGPAGATVDVEAYDLGSVENALGAFGAEKPPETRAASGGGTSWYRARNALFLARGPAYVRAIGSDESAPVLSQLEHLRRSFEGGVAAGERPWTVALFGEALGLPPDRLQYTAENAFSFGFARNVSSATLDDGETELFVLPAGDEAEARALAAQFEKGFLGYGEKAPVGGATWVRDRYLGAYSRAAAAGTMVVGVRGAPDAAKGAEALAKLERAVLALPPDVAKRASAGPPAAAKARGGMHE